ncbi:MAG: spermidine synthase [Planctomycetota bacterium]|jgi:spermidine synthase
MQDNPSTRTNSNLASALLVLALFLSGTAALVYEVTWIKRASLVFGSTTFAVGTILAVFFAGLGLGSYLFGKFSLRSQRPLYVFAVLELLIAVLAAISPVAFEWIDSFYGQFYSDVSGNAFASVAARLIFVAIILLPPCILMGASLPLFCRHFLQPESRFGRSIGSLYAINTLGGAAGAALAGFFLIPKLGLNATIYVAAATDLVVGASILLLRVSENASFKTDTVQVKAAQPSRHFVYLLLFAVSFVALGIEVLWTRQLSLLFRNSVHTYTLTLTVVLVGIVIGSFSVAPLLDRLQRRALTFGWLQALTGLSILVLMSLAPESWRTLGSELETCFLLFLPTAILSGAAFPLAIRMVVDQAEMGSFGTGKMAAVSSLGGVAGSTVMAMVLLPGYGLETSLHLLVGVSFVGALVTWFGLDRDSATSKRLFRSLVAIGIGVALFTQNDTRLPADFLAPRSGLIDFHEGYGSNLAVVRVDEDERRLEIDRWWQGTNRKNHQIFAAHLPMLLHPNPRRALVVGAGTGQTASRFLMYDIERFECVDIEPTIFEFIQKHFESSWMDDPRSHLIREDGRTHVRHGDSRYDVISVEVGQIFRPGVAYFYTTDFYEEARSKLNQQGLLVQFVPLAFLDQQQFESIIRTFTEVFPAAALWYNTGELLLLGTNAERFQIDANVLSKLDEPSDIRDDLKYSHWGGTEGALNQRDVFLSGFLLGSKELLELASTGTIYRDNLPVLDYATQTVDKTKASELPLVDLIEANLSSLTDVAAFEVTDVKRERIDNLRRLNLGQIKASALVRIAEVQRAANDHRGAVTTLKRAVNSNPKHFASRLLLADSSMFAGDSKAARENFKAAAEIRDTSGRAHYGLAVALFQAQELTEAAIHFNRAIELRPDDDRAHNGLGAVLSRLGDSKGARHHFEKALQLRPSSAEYRANLQRVGG